TPLINRECGLRRRRKAIRRRRLLRPRINKNKRNIRNSVAQPSCKPAHSAVILCTFGLWRVRLVVRTQPSQGWCTGSTPVRAAIPRSILRSLARGASNHLRPRCLVVPRLVASISPVVLPSRYSRDPVVHCLVVLCVVSASHL